MISSDKQLKNKTYCLSKNTVAIEAGESLIYVNTKNSSFVKVPQFIHQMFVKQNVNSIPEEYREFVISVIHSLKAKGFIMESIENVSLGKGFFLTVPDNRPNAILEKCAFQNLYFDSESILHLGELRKNGVIPEGARVHVILNSDLDDINRIEHCMLAGDYLHTNSCAIVNKILNIDINYPKMICLQYPGRIQESGSLQILQDAFHVGLKLLVSLSYFEHNIDLDTQALFREKNIKNNVFYDICDFFTCGEQAAGFRFDPDMTLTINEMSVMRVSLSCGAGTNKFYIQREGNVYPCIRLQNGKPLGNIFENSSDEIMKNATIAHDMAQCEDCKVKYFCAGGCKADKISGILPYCHEFKEHIESRLFATQ